MRWYVMNAGKIVGPVATEAIEAVGRSGKLFRGTFVRDEDSGTWMPVEQSPFAPLVRDPQARLQQLWGILGLGVLVWGAYGWYSCSKAISSTSSVVDPASVASAQPAADLEATDTIRVIRTYYNLGRAIAADDWEWSGCADDTKGYGALLVCEKRTAEHISALAATVPSTTVAASACGRAVETAHRAYFEAQNSFHAAHLAWLVGMQGKLARPMTGRTLRDACDETQCNGQPNSFEDKFAASNYSNINSIECVRQIFDCAPPTGNVCWFNKVANRLGLGNDKASGGILTVKATGNIVR